MNERTPAGKLGWRRLESHDFVNNALEHRLESGVGAPLMDCTLALNYTGKGVLYLYCGHEMGIPPPQHSGQPSLRVNCALAQTPAGQGRMALIRELAAGPPFPGEM